jgi:hypothetical protein
MKTRYLADELNLPSDWQAERYSTSIRLLGPYGRSVDIVLPYGQIDLEQLRAECADKIMQSRANP